MLMPSIFGENLFDDFMDFPFTRELGRKTSAPAAIRQAGLMKTDIREDENGFELEIDLPGYKKEDVSASLEKGVLTIEAVTQQENKEEKDNGKYIRRERFSGKCSRSFYVGEDVTQEDIHARFENGILKLTIPKKDPKQVEEKKRISIEG